MGMTVVEKILARASGQKSVKALDVVEPRVDLAMSHENAALVINQFKEIYAGTGRDPKPWDPSHIAVIFDHRVPAEGPKTANRNLLGGGCRDARPHGHNRPFLANPAGSVSRVKTMATTRASLALAPATGGC